MQRFSTSDLMPRDRLAFWNEVAGESLTRMSISPLLGSAFAGKLCSDVLGCLGLSTASSTQAVLRRTRSHIARSDQRVFLINLAIKGSFTISQCGREGVVSEGDFTINDSSEPFTVTHHEDCRAGVLKFPEILIKRYLPTVETLSGRPVSGQTGMGALASDAMKSLCRQMELDRCGELDTATVEHVTALVAGACAAQYGQGDTGTSATAWRRLEVRRYVESHLADPTLNARGVAQHFRISDRYLRMLFEAEGEGVHGYILRRRLEECAKRLTDPLWSCRTVSVIAFAWGFNSLGSFDRAFKLRYGVTPHEYRQHALK